MKYLDGFVFVVPKKKLGEYKKLAAEAGKIWKKFGALEYYETIGDDLNPKTGGMSGLTFPKLTKLKKDEDVWFSFILYKSKEERNKINKKVMAYFDKKYKDSKKEMNMPFDMRRFSYGGFKALIEERK